MKPSYRKTIAFLLATIIFLHSMQGCRTSKPVQDCRVADTITYVDVATYPFPKQKIIGAVNQLLLKRGYVVLPNESNDTTLIADYWSDEIMIEEYRDLTDKQNHPTFLSSLITFLGIIFLIGLVAASLNSSPDEEEEISSIIPADENDKTVYNYRLFVDVKELSDSTTEVAIDILKTTYKNDIETESVYLENKYINHSLIYGIDSCLRK
ncbi:MAG: hypothetical protein HZB59_13765 [Ignavibacteriales bacterium]|nr:hypothetical protein [Ignavibacteriales bacterium]